MYVSGDNAAHFDSIGVEYIPNEIEKLRVNKNITTNIHRTQASDSIMCRYFCIGIIDFMLKSKILLVHINLFSPNKLEKNDKIMLEYFQ